MQQVSCTGQPLPCGAGLDPLKANDEPPLLPGFAPALGLPEWPCGPPMLRIVCFTFGIGT